jgi:hypothetical protein
LYHAFADGFHGKNPSFFPASCKLLAELRQHKQSWSGWFCFRNQDRQNWGEARGQVYQ